MSFVYATLLVMVVLAAGCATTVGTDAVEARSGFDGARVVSIRPHGTACEALPCSSLGAQWNSKRPDMAILTVQVSDSKFSAITRVEFSIDGAQQSFRPAGPGAFASPHPPMRDSLQDFAVGVETLRKLASAQRAWVRVHTLDGYIEHRIVEGADDSKATHAMRRFLAKIDEQK